ncbi:hypothetical protein PAXRUDRAFT_18737 [Paxillus rubicundulus Ve08.2h10]|uniref:Uncharacterized protein n=1 Tax=Paxillus rubicundulus Ve08.2h10 TaxID=930991 RepID=A0A0D0CX69_9AGAM|nr:hypothetical protein PAXRUDRAFT_18737 [Paxillus rubicundulus Ve08.2h10]
MAVIAINKILEEVRAKYLPGAKVPSVVIAVEMQMFPIDQVITRGWPLLQAILKPGLEVSTHIWAQVPKLILKGKGVDPLECGGAMEAGGSKVEGKQVPDGNQGGKGGEKGKKKKEKKEKTEKKIERVAKGSDGGQESRAAKLACNLSWLAKRPREQSRAPIQVPEPPKAPSPGPSKGPACRSSWATSKPPVTPSKRAPSLAPGPSPSKEAKALVSKLRPKTPSISQNEKFANDVGVTPSGSIKASALELVATPINPLLDPRSGPPLDPKDQIIKGLKVRIASLEKQVERIPDLELQLSSMARVVEALREQVQGQLAAPSFPTSSHRLVVLPVSVSHQMQRLHLEMSRSNLKSAFLALEAEGQPSSHLSLQLVSTSADGGKLASSPLHLLMDQQPPLGVEMEDDTSGDTSDADARPPLPIPPPFTDLVPPIESCSSEVDMESEDVDME